MYKKYLTLEDKIMERMLYCNFCPEALYNISKSSKFPYNGKNLNSMFVIDLVHTLIVKYYLKNKLNKFVFNYIEDKLCKYYSDYIQYLTERNIIKQIKNYSVGHSSREYILSDSIISGKISRVHNRDIKMLIKYKKHMVSYITDTKYDIIFTIN